MKYFIDVIVPIPLPKPFTYWVSKDEYQFLRLGHRVGVPFGKKKIYTAIVVNKHKILPKTYEPKTIEVILDEEPIVTEHQLRFWDWISKYYMCPLGDVLRAALPSAFLLTSETKIKRIELDHEIISSLDDDEYLIYEALEKRELSLDKIDKIIVDKKSISIVNKMISKGLLKSKSELIEKYKPKNIRYYRLNPIYSNKNILSETLEKLSPYPKQRDVILSIFNFNDHFDNWINADLLKKNSGSGASSFKALVNKNILNEKFFQEDRIVFPYSNEIKKTKLSKVQANSLSEIKNAFIKKDVVLLKGVTSSGKTEVYIELIQEQLNQGKQVLYLVPEIALTSQMIHRLQNRFGAKVIVYHSKFTLNERVEMWHQIIENKQKAQIILGARSSILLPFKNLGLIIVDEEHDGSFKQFDPSPRYHARDLAVFMASSLKIKTILGSATPSIETYFNVKEGKYGYVELLERYGGVQMPRIRCIDLKEAYKKKQMKGFFSQELINQIQKSLNSNKQIILFQNRRGYAPIIECMTCGNIPQCANCDVALTFHQYNEKMRCHYCGYNIAKPVYCNSCGNNDFNTRGIGTQQIEEQIDVFFPDTKVARMDWDSTREKKSFDKIIKQFTKGEIQILVGTQMITKGLDFKNVSLVGVLNADSLINFPDFRAHERGFQMLSQVAGRSGRSTERGEVIIQTFNPDHILLNQIIKYDFEGMYNNQMLERGTYKFPPSNRLIKITLKSRDYSKVDSASIWMANLLIQSLKKSVLGPVSPEISKIRNQYNKQILIKFSDRGNRVLTKKIIFSAIKSFDSIAAFKTIRVSIDVDPY